MGKSLVFYGHEALKKIADEISDIDGEVVKLIESMYNVMYGASGIGLAAPQVNVSKRVIVVDIGEKNGPPLMLINPVIKEVSDSQEPYEEGCLSIPGIMKEIIRPTVILVSGYDIEGNEIEIEAGGLLARVTPHEIDHLNGILFIDRLEDYQKKELRPELKKIKKLNKAQ